MTYMSCTTCPTTSCTCCHVPNVLVDNNLTVNQTVTITACGNAGNALVVNNSGTCTQTSGDLVQINGETTQSALRVVSGDVHVDSGNLTVSGSVSSSSDASLKTNIQPITNALDIVNQLNGVRFDWVDTYTPTTPAAVPQNVGLLAQNVQTVVPEVVSEHNGHLMVAYSQLVSVLIEAVKELSVQVDELQSAA